MDYLNIKQLYHSSDVRREKDKLLAEFEVFNKDFLEDLPYPVRDVLDRLLWRFRQEEWFSEAWEKYRQHVLDAGLGGNIKMPGYVFKPYLERYVDEHQSQFNSFVNGEAAYSDMEIGDYLQHHGVKGMKWGLRRYQNEDGSLTMLGKQHYNTSDNSSEKKRDYIDAEFHDIPKNNKSSNTSKSEKKQQRKHEKNVDDFVNSFKKKEVNKDNSTISEKEHKKNVDDFINSFKKKETPKKEEPKKEQPKNDAKSKKDKELEDFVKKVDDPNYTFVLGKDNRSKKEQPKKADAKKEQPKKEEPKKADTKTSKEAEKVAKEQQQKEYEKKQRQKEINALSGTRDILNATGNLTDSINKAIPKGQTKKIYADYSHMTDQEIQHEIKRISSERALSDLKGETQYIKSGREKAKDILSGVGAGIGVATSALTLLILFKKLKSKEDSVESLDEITGDYLQHHGVKGMKWGQRRYQHPDGTLTEEGKKHYNTGADTPEGFERDRTSKGTSDIINQSPRYDKFVRKQQRQYTKYAKRAGAKKGAVVGLAIGGIGGATAAMVADIYKGQYTRGSKFVADVAFGAFEGALGGATIGGILGRMVGKKSAKAHLADKGKEYTDKLLQTPANRIGTK